MCSDHVGSRTDAFKCGGHMLLCNYYTDQTPNYKQSNFDVFTENQTYWLCQNTPNFDCL